MATKILITPKNSVWGVIVNPQSSNTYRHALSFDNASLKEAFINKELFNGGDYKSLLAAQSEVSFTRISATTGTFIVEPSQYPNETFLSLLNKDFCIIEEDGVEQFYTLSGERDREGGNTIVFTAELDIFFTYDIKAGMFNNKEVNINRAMSDRFVKDQAGNIVPIYEDKTKLLKTPFFNNDPADNSITPELLIPKDAGKNLFPSLTNYLANPNQENLIQTILNNMNWFVFYTGLEKDGNIKWATSTPISTGGKGSKASPVWYSGRSKILSNNENDIALGKENLAWYGAVITCNGSVDITLNGNLNSYSFKVKIGDKIYDPSQANDAALQDAATFKGSLTPLPHHPFSHFGALDTSYIEFTLDENTKILQLEFKQKYLELEGTSLLSLGGITGATSETGKIPFHFTLGSSLYDLLQTSSIDYSIFPDIIFNPDPLAKFNEDNEIRLNISPYTKLKIGSSTKNKMLLSPQYFNSLNTKQIKYRTTFGYMLEAYSTITEILDYENIYISANPRDNTNIFEDIANYSLPTITDAFNEYIARNKATLNTNMLKSIGSGVLGIGAAAGGGTFGAVAGIGAIAKSIGDIASQAAMIKDLKASPDKLNATGSTLLLDTKMKRLSPYLQRLVLYPQLTKLLAQHFYKLGYSYKDELININTVLKSRYWFNFIQAEETFENIILQASAEIKQIINDTLNSGLTIWHVRDLNTFNGIKNYENENVEMSLLAIPADEGNLEW